MSRTKVYLPVLVSMLLVGCSSEPERLAVSGVVLLDGKAMSNCTVVIQSLAAEGSPIGASAVLSNGRFEISKANGLVAGVYGVVFTENQPDLEDYEAARSSGSKYALNKKFIPPKYTTTNDLRIKISANMQPVSLNLKSR